jgi:Zn-dependent protease
VPDPSSGFIASQNDKSRKVLAVFFEPNATQFDLRFRLFGIAVRVSPWFWIMMAALGWGGGPGRGERFLQHLVIWIACAFISILIHELGHVLVGRLFGSDGHIVLYGMGGLAIGSNALDRRWQRIAVSAAGPGADFLLLGVIWGAVVLSGLNLDRLPLARMAYGDLVWINLVWGMLNLLPVYPLDGGQISRDVCGGLWRDRGERISLGISTCVAGAIAGHALALTLSPQYTDRVEELVLRLGSWADFLADLGDWYVAIFFGLLALSSFMALQHLEAQHRWHDHHWQD